MAAIMADKEDGVKMDDYADPFVKELLEVFLTTGNAFSMLDRSLKAVKGFSLVYLDCLLLRLGVQ